MNIGDSPETFSTKPLRVVVSHKLISTFALDRLHLINRHLITSSRSVHSGRLSLHGRSASGVCECSDSRHA